MAAAVAHQLSSRSTEKTGTHRNKEEPEEVLVGVVDELHHVQHDGEGSGGSSAGRRP